MIKRIDKIKSKPEERKRLKELKEKPVLTPQETREILDLLIEMV